MWTLIHPQEIHGQSLANSLNHCDENENYFNILNFLHISSKATDFLFGTLDFICNTVCQVYLTGNQSARSCLAYFKFISTYCRSFLSCA